MEFVNSLCRPAFIYLVISAIHVTMLVAHELWASALGTAGYSLIITYLLNRLCVNDLKWVSWLFIAIPFIILPILVIVGIGFGVKELQNTIKESVNKENFDQIPQPSNGFEKQ
jgi:uncharacterized membrane-anchored protein YitT (DUF2179 family)